MACLRAARILPVSVMACPMGELADLEHLGEDLLGADLALVEDDDQGPGGVGEQGSAVAAAGLAPRAAALLEGALLGPGGLRGASATVRAPSSARLMPVSRGSARASTARAAGDQGC